MYLFACESVSAGHPDKCADIIADRIVDKLLSIDPNARVATEVFVVDKNVIIGGEVRVCKKLDKDFYIECAKEALEYIGYPESGFNQEETIYPELLHYEVYVHEQSSEIAQGVEQREDFGAGDQGMMVGYATDERADFMPHAIMIARQMRDILYNNAKLHPELFGVDIKTEVVLDYGTKENFDKGLFERIDTIVVAQSHSRSIDEEEVRKRVKELLYKGAFVSFIDSKTKFIINGTGSFITHGPIADSGLTGRKIAVDNYGAYAPIGGGAQSTKDYTKVDRSAHYAARWLAKHIVAAKLAKKALVEIAYVIGQARPLSLMVNTFGTGKMSDERLSQLLFEHFPLTPRWIMERFSLHKPQGFSYMETAAKGQVGYEHYPWEQLDYLDWFVSLS
ncbi:S-adenosylmethionine synthetase [Nitratiruptor sp. YY08-26]|uniref:methionine adenosyltransferase n=1 Tax=unclassified Nitratiruptor TaxID=2624044 RepID=UPI001915D8FA|nr:MULTISPECIES: methionine adenosyltransferase [unclassified Nitratiruptor]BCD62444.1 S-adenosylmethionine synthetase [Nitratiruptor sp. YY08-13]BCD66380.1 S-adenosylmethionine synthetase [Nitratiruptor sp. YY08-26]